MNKLIVAALATLLASCTTNKNKSAIVSTTTTTNVKNDSSTFFSTKQDTVYQQAKKYEYKPKSFPTSFLTLNFVDTTNTKDTGQLAFRIEQKNYRNIILARLENQIVKNSFLQEYYVRNAVKVNGKKLDFLIHFNVHFPDCGAPDCYSNDLSFSIPFNNKVEFPESFTFNEREHGCTVRDKTITGIYILQEESAYDFIYYNAAYKRTLIIAKKYEFMSDLVNLIPNTKPNMVTSKNIDTFWDTNENDESPNFPWRDRSLSYPEYERFLE